MRRTMTGQIGVIVIIVLFISMLISMVSNYWTNYQSTYEAAGMEAVGCANITTGLIDPEDVKKAMSGDDAITESLQDDLNWTVEHKHIFEDQYIIQLDGELLAIDENLEGQGFSVGDDFYLDEAAVEQILETKEPAYSEVYTYGDMERLTGYAPIFEDHDPDKEIIALNAIDFDAKIVSERTFDSVKASFVLGLIPMIVAAVVTIWLIRKKTRPLSILNDYASNIAEGHLDIDDISIKNKDEIGQLASTLNYMAEQLRTIIQQFKTNADYVAASAEELSASVDQTSDSVEQIAATMQELESGVSKQAGNIEETSQIAKDMASGIQQIAGNAGHVSNTSIDASQKASQGTEKIHNTVEQMNSITNNMNDLGDVVSGLEERSNEIDQIVNVITDIADQTNLLALNAAIEAARAGENGRGFAVVADEVRQLAEQSAGSAKQISELVSTIQEETRMAVQSMDTTKKDVEEGIAVVHTAGDSFEQIKESINDVSREIQDVSAAVEELAAGTEQMEASMTYISEAGEAINTGTEEVSASTESQSTSMDEIVTSINSLSTMANESRKIIEKFRL